MTTLGRKDYRVHRLVALAFLTRENGKLEVNHKDGDKTNAALSNLSMPWQRD